MFVIPGKLSSKAAWHERLFDTLPVTYPSNGSIINAGLRASF
jgi:hypothetical protein